MNILNIMNTIENILRKRLDNDIVNNITMTIWKEEHKSKFNQMIIPNGHQNSGHNGPFKYLKFSFLCNEDSCHKMSNEISKGFYEFCINNNHERTHYISTINYEFSYVYKYSKKDQRYKVKHTQTKLDEEGCYSIRHELGKYREFIR